MLFRELAAKLIDIPPSLVPRLSLKTMSFTTLADRTVCINLLERDDRLEQAKAQFTAVGLGDVVEFHRVNRHPRGGKYGCYDSHRSVIQKAYDDGLERVLIFEDDVKFTEGWEKVVAEARAFIDSGTAFDALFLGCAIRFVDEKSFPNIWRVKCCQAHAYIVSKEGMGAFLAHSDQFESGIDNFSKDLIQLSAWQNMYGYTSEIIIQDDDFGSDLNWLPGIPKEYSVWLQKNAVHRYFALLQPLIRSDWYRRSWFGRNYILAVDNYVVDDGRIRLQGLWVLDTIVVFLLALVAKPPYGYLALVRDLLPYVKHKLMANRSVTRKKQESK